MRQVGGYRETEMKGERGGKLEWRDVTRPRSTAEEGH